MDNPVDKEKDAAIARILGEEKKSARERLEEKRRRREEEKTPASIRDVFNKVVEGMKKDAPDDVFETPKTEEAQGGDYTPPNFAKDYVFGSGFESAEPKQETEEPIPHDDTFNLKVGAEERETFNIDKQNAKFQELLDEEFERFHGKSAGIADNIGHEAATAEIEEQVAEKESGKEPFFSLENEFASDIGGNEPDWLKKLSENKEANETVEPVISEPVAEIIEETTAPEEPAPAEGFGSIFEEPLSAADPAPVIEGVGAFGAPAPEEESTESEAKQPIIKTAGSISSDEVVIPEVPAPTFASSYEPPAVEETPEPPAVEETPAVEEAPAAEETFVVTETPATEEAPAETPDIASVWDVPQEVPQPETPAAPEVAVMETADIASPWGANPPFGSWSSEPVAAPEVSTETSAETSVWGDSTSTESPQPEITEQPIPTWGTAPVAEPAISEPAPTDTFATPIDTSVWGAPTETPVSESPAPETPVSTDAPSWISENSGTEQPAPQWSSPIDDLWDNAPSGSDVAPATSTIETPSFLNVAAEAAEQTGKKAKKEKTPKAPKAPKEGKGDSVVAKRVLSIVITLLIVLLVLVVASIIALKAAPDSFAAYYIRNFIQTVQDSLPFL